MTLLPKIKAFALVRDKDGRPKVDDPHNLPREIAEILTPEDWDYLNSKKD